MATNDSQEVALERLQRGEIAALAFVGGKPAPLFRGLKASSGLHFLSIPADPRTVEAYVPTQLTAADYPDLVLRDQPVDTVAVGTVLMAANLPPRSERYRNTANFVDVFFTNFQQLLEPGHHPKWREVNLAAEVPGWRRFPPAEQWLRRNANVASRVDVNELRSMFSRFIESRQQSVGGAGDDAAAAGRAVQRVHAVAKRSGPLSRPVKLSTMGLSIRTRVLAVGLLFGVLGLVGTARAGPAPKHGGTLVFAVDAEPENYDCHANVSFAFLHPVAPHYSTLLKFDPANYPQVEGDLAASWSVSPDNLTYTFNLRPNVLFHDGSPLTSADVKASYERIVHPAPGNVSARQVDYATIASIDTPDPLRVVFHLRWPEAGMLAKFASPWNCIYSAAKLREDPQFPKTHVLGTGPFAFVEHVKGQRWIGKRWDRYFQPDKPYLNGYEADFIAGASVIKGIESGRIMAEFRSVTPAERDELVAAMGDRVSVYESPWIINLLLVFNVRQNPFDDARVRRALSLAIDRWGMAEAMAQASFLKFVGGVLRPGSIMATPEAELSRLPGFSRDIAASRDQARRLLAEAGVRDLRIALTNRDIAMPYGVGADAVVAAWREVGVTATQEKLGTKDWQSALRDGRFAVAFDFGGDYFDDPTLQLTRYVSRDLSSTNTAGSTDRRLDALYIGQALTIAPQKRVQIVRDFERRALTEAYTVPILWWNRIVVTAAAVKGWEMTPSHYIGQDLTDVWIER